MRRKLPKRARLYEKQFGQKADWVRSLPCAACKRDGPSDPAHMRSRGAGGTSEHLVPLCRMCHIEQHTRGIKTFFADHAHLPDRFELAKHYQQLYERECVGGESDKDLAF
jgi:hypothetical protein